MLYLFDCYAFYFCLRSAFTSNILNISSNQHQLQTVAVFVMRKAIIYQIDDLLVVSHGGNFVSDNTENDEIKTDVKQLK